MDTKLKEAVQTLIEALSADKSEGSYYYSWQANIAMAFKDEGEIFTYNNLTKELLHKIANDGAKRFLDHLCRQPVVIGYGSKVRYCPRHGGPEKKGIIKEVSGVVALVVFHCNEEWDKFEDYTGQATNIADLKIGWE